MKEIKIGRQLDRKTDTQMGGRTNGYNKGALSLLSSSMTCDSGFTQKQYNALVHNRTRTHKLIFLILTHIQTDILYVRTSDVRTSVGNFVYFTVIYMIYILKYYESEHNFSNISYIYFNFFYTTDDPQQKSFLYWKFQLLYLFVYKISEFDSQKYYEYQDKIRRDRN